MKPNSIIVLLFIQNIFRAQNTKCIKMGFHFDVANSSAVAGF